MCRLYFCPTAVTGVSSLPGELPWHNPERAGAARAVSQSVSLLHDDLRQHGSVGVRGSRVQPRAVRGVTGAICLTRWVVKGGGPLY